MVLKCNFYELFEPQKMRFVDHEIDLRNLEGSSVVAETIYSAISPGTEVGAYNGVEPLRNGNAYPRIIGYCNVAKIIALGEDVKKFKTNDFILTHQSHRSAFLISEKDIICKIPAELDLRHATTAYLYHLGYHSLLTANAQSGHNIGVIGAGVLGYTTSVLCKTMGAKTCVFTNQSERNLLFNKLDIYSYSKNFENLDRILINTNNRGLDIIINTSNTWEDWMLAINLINKGGTIVNLGFPGRGEGLPTFNPLDPKFIYVKNVTIKALSPLAFSDEHRFNLNSNIEYLLNLMQKKIIDPNEIISETIHFTKLQEQYIRYTQRKVPFTTLLEWKK